MLQLNAQDNIGLALTDLKAGDKVILETGQTLLLLDDIPRLHKVALSNIQTGQAVIKYGQTIALAGQTILAGQHVHTHNCAPSEHNRHYQPSRLAKATEYVPLAQQKTFMGYDRGPQKIGTRNYIGIVTSVNCSATVAKQIAQHFTNVKQQWPNVDGVVALTHGEGCGMRNDDEGYEVLQRTFFGHLTHPNFGGVLLIGLGCETMQIADILQKSHLVEGDTLKAFNIQDLGGTRPAIQQGIDCVNAMLPLVNACQRTPVPASELILAVQCGGSDALSGVTANPALGVAADWVVKHGGTVIYSETPEIYGAEHLLTQRAQTPEVAQQLIDRITWWENYTRKHGFNMDNNPSPGNKQGGLTTIVEKSLGAQAKGGSTNLNAVCLYAEKPSQKGLVFMDSPGYDPVSVTGQVASGANIVCFTTGRGSAFGYKPVPSLKLCSNTPTYQLMQEDMDINCGAILDGDITLPALGEAIFNRILAVASGELSKSEELGYGDAEFNPWKIGAVM